MSRIAPAMNDARCFTSYMPSSQTDQILASMYKVNDQTSYRMALQANMKKADREMRKLYVCQRVVPKAWYNKNR